MENEAQFTTVLVLFNNPAEKKYQEEKAFTAMAAARKAELKNPGYICIEAYIIED